MSRILVLKLWLFLWPFQGISVLSLTQPSWQSDWLPLSSQQDQDSFMELYHGLGEIPFKGKALVRPFSGPNKGFVFEGIGSAQWDDDFGKYCGVVFMYNDQHARLWAPAKDNANDAAWAFCAGMEGWSTGDGYTQTEHDVEVKVLLWLAAQMPAPDVLVDWTDVDCADANNVFMEFANPLGEELGLVQLQVKVVGTGSTTWISEGIGSANFDSREEEPPGTYINQGGVIYSHSNQAVRMWIRHPVPPDTTNVVTYVGDGWAGTYKYVREGTGQVRLMGWRKPTDLLFHYQFDADVDAGSFQEEVLLQPQAWNPLTSLISLQVTPLDGENEGFTFYGMGIMPREPYAENHYGGVQFGYTQSMVRLFYPVRNNTGCLASITQSWGYLPGTHQQCARRARIDIKIWGQQPQIGVQQELLCTMTTRGSMGPLPQEHVNLCTKRCMLSPGCIAVKLHHSTGECQLLDYNQANQALVNMDSSNEILIVAKNCEYATK